jgi:hypothetical protein
LFVCCISVGPEAQSGKVPQRAAAVSPIFGIAIQPGYRDWKLISVAHEEGNLNDIRAVLGNDNKVFGRAQSFVAGSQPEWYLQFMVKDSKKVRLDGWVGVRSV